MTFYQRPRKGLVTIFWVLAFLFLIECFWLEPPNRWHTLFATFGLTTAALNEISKYLEGAA